MLSLSAAKTFTVPCHALVKAMMLLHRGYINGPSNETSSGRRCWNGPSNISYGQKLSARPCLLTRPRKSSTQDGSQRHTVPQKHVQGSGGRLVRLTNVPFTTLVLLDPRPQPRALSPDWLSEQTCCCLVTGTTTPAQIYQGLISIQSEFEA